jgi:hypothetical protein
MFNPQTAPYYAIYLREFGTVPATLAGELAAAPVRDEVEVEAAIAAIARDAFAFCLLAALAAPAHAEEKAPEKCSCSRTEPGTIQCNMACMQPASPEIIAALRKLYPDLEERDVMVFDDTHAFNDGRRHYSVAFTTSEWKKDHAALTGPSALSRPRVKAMRASRHVLVPDDNTSAPIFSRLRVSRISCATKIRLSVGMASIGLTHSRHP